MAKFAFLLSWWPKRIKKNYSNDVLWTFLPIKKLKSCHQCSTNIYHDEYAELGNDGIDLMMMKFRNTSLILYLLGSNKHRKSINQVVVAIQLQILFSSQCPPQQWIMNSGNIRIIMRIRSWNIPPEFRNNRFKSIISQVDILYLCELPEKVKQWKQRKIRGKEKESKGINSITTRRKCQC